MNKTKQAILILLITVNSPFAGNRSDVFLQGFYWNSPPGGIWWNQLASQAPELASAGFNGIWIPSPVKGAGGGYSMGYDPYDHYDFGEYNQKGGVETRFGSRDELEQMISTFHSAGIEVYADVVMNHMNGGEAKIPFECKPYPEYPDSGWLKFEYPHGSRRFPKDASSFYPNSQTCDVNPDYHGASDPIFQFGVWLAHDRDAVRDSLIVWGEYLRQTMGFDGFRLDVVKGIDPWFLGLWLDEVNGDNAFAVAEYYGDIDAIKYWLNSTLNNGGSVAMFDFPLRFTLQEMCMNSTGSFDMCTLDNAGLLNSGVSGYNVSTFVENHDLDRVGWDGSGADDPAHNPISSNKDLAYAYVLFSEGRPTVFYKDYFKYGLKGKIDTLIWLRANYLGGGTDKRSELKAWFIREDGNQDQNTISQDLYVARRTGYNNQPGGYLLINDNPTQWIDVWVNAYDTVGTVYRDYSGHDADKSVMPPDGSGPNRIKLWCPPRSYSVYVADTRPITHTPEMNPLPDFTIWTLAPFEYTPDVQDADNDIVSFQLTATPKWLSVSDDGILYGIPAYGDTGIVSVILVATDITGNAVQDTFSITIKPNLPPALQAPISLSATATERFEYQSSADDPENDRLYFFLKFAPEWLHVESNNGLLNGTPAMEDTGYTDCRLIVTDYKGVFDTADFVITVRETSDSLIGTYGKPLIDGTVNESVSDWQTDWHIASDPADDSAWSDSLSANNELYALFTTWDADSLYIGTDYYLNDVNNTLIIYLNWNPDSGLCDFNSENGYHGDHPKNILLPDSLAADGFIADYYKNAPGFWRIHELESEDLSDRVNGRRGNSGNDMEIAISWNDLFGLGAGKVTHHARIDLFAIIAGGYNWGAGDAMPDNPNANGDSGPDSLVNWVSVCPDSSGDGIPDPTVWIFTSIMDAPAQIPANFELYGNYPNPFNPRTAIRFAIPAPTKIHLTIYNLQGQKIAEFNEFFGVAGQYSIIWKGLNQRNMPVSSGVYFYHIDCNSTFLSGKMLLLK